MTEPTDQWVEEQVDELQQEGLVEPSDSISPPKNKDGGRNESRLVRVRGSEIADSDVTEVETLTLLGREGYLQKEGATMISSYPKAGKTTLLKELALEWAAQDRKILIFTEEHRKTWEVRLQEEPDRWENVDFVFALGADRDAILAEIVAGTEDVVVIDTLRNCLGFRKETDNSEIAALVSPFVTAARDGDKTLIGFVHETKAGGEYGRGIAGGHGLLGVFDAALEIHRVPEADNRRKVKCLARLLDPPELLYEKKEDGSLELLGAAHLVKKEEVERRVRDTLNEEERTLNQIREALGEPLPALTNVTKALETLVALGHAIRSGAGKRGDPYRWRDSFLPPKVSIGESNESPDSPEETRERNESDPAEGQISKRAGQGADSGSSEPEDSFLPSSSNENRGERNESVSMPPPIDIHGERNEYGSRNGSHDAAVELVKEAFDAEVVLENPR